MSINSFLCEFFEVLPSWLPTPKRFAHGKTLTKIGENNKSILSLSENKAINDQNNKLNKEQNSSSKTLSLDKIDSFLLNDFSFNLKKKESGNQQDRVEEPPFLLPMVIEISNPNWKSKMPLSHHKEFHRSDHIVACYGSIEDVKALNDDPEVICVEAADVG
jgi:hypothetical protein